MPDLDAARKGQGRQPKRLQGHDRLEEHDGLAFVPAFHQYARRQGKQQGWQGVGNANDAQVEGTA